MKVHIFGAGFSGCVCARALAEKGIEVWLYEKNNHIGGNAYDVWSQDILIHPYGPHIFHTNKKSIYDFLSKFTEWTPYTHKVLGLIDGVAVPIPFNMESLHILFDEESVRHIVRIMEAEYRLGDKISVLELKNHNDEKIARFGAYVYEKVFYHYTLKQWGFPPEQLPKGVTERVPVCLSTDDRYFTDTYQAMPKDGYHVMFNNMIKHDKIKLCLSSTVKVEFMRGGDISLGEKLLPSGDKIVFTGCIDELLHNKFGSLPYRSLRFDFERHETSSYQNAAVVNYTTSEAYTRITEYTKFTCKEQQHTIIVKEYPIAHEQGHTIPYYPIEREENKLRYESYLAYLSSYPAFYPLGRLAEYRYINMDIAAEGALGLAEEIATSRLCK